MVVLIVNLTDARGCKHSPTQIDIYNKTLDPGDSLRIPADLVDKKIRSLEMSGFISIGQIPSWYSNAKATRGRQLTLEERSQRITPKVTAKTEAGSKKIGLSIVDDVLPAVEELVVSKRKR